MPPDDWRFIEGSGDKKINWSSLLQVLVLVPVATLQREHVLGRLAKNLTGFCK
jgi:hypothetical protein